MPEDSPSAAECDPVALTGGRWRQAVFLWAGALGVCALLATLLQMAYSGGDGDGGYFVIVCLYALCGAAAFSDAALRRIPNSFNYTALVLALLLNMFVAPLCELLDWTGASLWIGANYGQWGGVALESLKGFGLCLLVGVVSFAARGLGGGDVKLLAALGALAGWSLTISILLNTLLVAAALGVVNLLCGGYPVRGLQAAALWAYRRVVAGATPEPQRFRRTESPFCLSLLLGLALLPVVNLHAQLAQWLAAITG